MKDAVKSFTLNARDLRQSRKEAAMHGKQSIWLIQFPGFVLECHILPEGWEPDDSH